MSRRIIFIALPLSLLLAWFFYKEMGGGEPIIPERIQLSSHTIAGEWFEGRPSNPELEEVFYRMRDGARFADSTYLAVVNVPMDAKDTIRQFIGILEGPAGSSRFELPAGEYVSVTMGMHSSVQPSPEKVREEAQKLARLEPWEIQLFTSESEITVLFKVAD